MPSFAPEAMKEYTTTRQLMERYSVPGLVLRLGVPAMVGQVFNLLYSIVDRIFVGRIPGTGEQALAAIGICAPPSPPSAPSPTWWASAAPPS